MFIDKFFGMLLFFTIRFTVTLSYNQIVPLLMNTRLDLYFVVVVNTQRKLLVHIYCIFNNGLYLWFPKGFNSVVCEDNNWHLNKLNRNLLNTSEAAA